MGINLKQDNKFGDNNAQFSQSGNETKIINKFVWKARSEGFVAGIIISIIANFIYDFFAQVK